MKQKYLYTTLVLFAGVAIGAWTARHFGWYNTYWFTDVTLHITSGIAFASFWVWMLRHTKVSNTWIVIASAITFAVFGSYLWEIWEFAGWKLFPEHVHFYQPELGDSLKDIACGMLGGFLFSLVSFKNLTHRERIS